MSFIQNTVTALFTSAFSKSAVQIFETAADAGKDRQLLGEVLDVLRYHLRDILLYNEGFDTERVVDINHAHELLKHHPCPRMIILRQLKAIDEAQIALRGNVNPTLTLENLVLEMRQEI